MKTLLSQLFYSLNYSTLSTLQPQLIITARGVSATEASQVDRRGAGGPCGHGCPPACWHTARLPAHRPSCAFLDCSPVRSCPLRCRAPSRPCRRLHFTGYPCRADRRHRQRPDCSSLSAAPSCRLPPPHHSQRSCSAYSQRTQHKLTVATVAPILTITDMDRYRQSSTPGLPSPFP